MRGIVFTPDRNTRRADFTGAFLPEARAFIRAHQLPARALVRIDISKSDQEMRAQVLEAIKREDQLQGILETVAFFCHGWCSGIQLGFSVNNVVELACALKPLATRDIKMPLYACSAARDRDGQIEDDIDPNSVGGDGGFADQLRDAICSYAYAIDCRVLAHVTAGHATRNPWVRFFEGGGQPYGGKGGVWVVKPKGPLWKRWIRWLAEGNNRFRLPFMSIDEVQAELEHPEAP